MEFVEASPIEQKIIVGQKAAIRRVNPSDAEEMYRLLKIENDPNRIRWFYSEPQNYKPLSSQGLIEEVSPNPHNMIFAVSGAPENEEIRQNDEEGKLQGLIYINPDEEERVDQLWQQQLLLPDSPFVYEVSFAKLEGAPHGQMASGLREVCFEIARLNSEVTDDNSVPNTTVVAYVMSDDRGTNEPSIRVLEASGFEEKGKVQYDEEARDKDKTFILNWDKLNEILKDQSGVTQNI